MTPILTYTLTQQCGPSRPFCRPCTNSFTVQTCGPTHCEVEPPSTICLSASLKGENDGGGGCCEVDQAIGHPGVIAVTIHSAAADFLKDQAPYPQIESGYGATLNGEYSLTRTQKIPYRNGSGDIVPGEFDYRWEGTSGNWTLIIYTNHAACEAFLQIIAKLDTDMGVFPPTMAKAIGECATIIGIGSDLTHPGTGGFPRGFEWASPFPNTRICQPRIDPGDPDEVLVFPPFYSIIVPQPN